ncbi:MAG: hypothetical protein M3130_10005 [Actinomycetota bacterium]|nr:hypothetical protein [Actinomycetota bacterium]
MSITSTTPRPLPAGHINENADELDITTLQQDRAAVVTGVGTPRGIGRVVESHLAEEGCSLARVSAAGADEITLELLTHGARAEGAVEESVSPRSPS